MSIQDRLRGPASLLSLAASYVIGPAGRRGDLAATAARIRTGAAAAIAIGLDVRRAPILRPERALLAGPDELVPVCTLVSDTHLTAPAHGPCELAVDPGQWPWRDLPRSADLAAGLSRALAAIDARGPHTLIWCGDEVDTGDAAEWAVWRDVCAAHPRLAHRIIPGNHDICFNRPFDADYTLARRATRELAYQAHAGPLGEFPIADTLITDAGPVTLVLLDSCRHRSTHILSNAVGKFGEAQLDELTRILHHAAGPLLVVSHHHVWRDAPFLEPEAWYNTVCDADRLLAILSAYRRRARRNQVLVCHGHRHTLTAGMIGAADAPIAVVGLPSTTLGDKATTGVLDGIVRYGVAGLRADGSWGVALHALGPLVAASGARTRRKPATPPGPGQRALEMREALP